MSNNQPKKKKSIFRRILKWTGITFLLLLLAIIILPFIFKDKIIQLVKDEANKSLNAKVDFGEFDIALFSSFPDFRFTIDSVSVIGVGEFEKDTLAWIKQTKLDVNLISVVKGEKYEVKQILLDQPYLYGKVLSSGKANWDIVKPDTAAKAPEAVDTAATKFALTLNKFEIKNGTMRYDDATMGMTSRLDSMDFTLDGDFTQDIFDMNINSEIGKLNFGYGGIPYAKDMRVKIKMDVGMDLLNMKFTLKENEFDLNDLALALDGWLDMKEDIKTDIKFSCKQTEFKSLLSLVPAVYSKDFASVKTSGKLSLNGFAKGTYNDKSMPSFGLHLEVANAMFKYPSLPKSVNNIQINLDVNSPGSTLDGMIIDLNKFHMEMAGNPIDARMNVKNVMTDPAIDGMVKGKIILASVKEFVPMEKGDELNGTINMDVDLNGRMSMIEQEKYDEFKAAGFVEIDKMNYKTTTLPYDIMINAMRLNFTPKYVELANFDSKMGRSDIKMSGKIEDFMQYIFKDSLIKGNFALTSNLLDLNQLMASTDTTVAAPAAADTAAMAVVEVPKNIDFVLNSTIGKLIYDKIDITNVSGGVIVRNARVSMEKLKMDLLDGNMVIGGYYDTKNMKKPAINFDLNISNFDIQKTFTAFNSVQKLAPIGQYAKGKFSTTLTDLVGTLNEKMEPDLTSLTGKGNFKTNAVVVEGFEPFVKLGDALKMEKLKKMEFKDINLLYKFKDGRVEIDPFKTKVQNVAAEISGSTGFDQTIDYKWDMEIPTKDLGTQANSVVQGLMGKVNTATGQNMSVPEKIKATALIGGTVTKPVVKTGMKDAMKDVKNEVKEQVKELIEEKKQEVIADVKEKAREEADKILADAQKQADNIKAEAAKAAEQIRAEGNKQADDLQNKGGNPIEKIANKKLAEKLRKESEAKAQKVTDEANVKADKVMQEARTKADEKLK
ncbi:MAG: hypothetical protein K0S33_3976 [Bacteroidetes bacterium]|jgi:uncharacterized protein involved in outer membrane biogenesis|nr:hypothetical protein [Bacteroidota bacterium]